MPIEGAIDVRDLASGAYSWLRWIFGGGSTHVGQSSGCLVFDQALRVVLGGAARRRVAWRARIIDFDFHAIFFAN